MYGWMDGKLHEKRPQPLLLYVILKFKSIWNFWGHIMNLQISYIVGKKKPAWGVLIN